MNNKYLVPTIILLLVFGLGGYKWYSMNHPQSTNQQITSSTEVNATATPSMTGSSSTVQHDPIMVDNPQGAVTYKGVIEVGASGFNAFAVKIDANKNWSLEYKEFGQSLAYEGFASTEDVKQGLKTYIGKIFNKGVNGKNIHFVISSGALKNPKTELIAQAIEQMGYTVNRVTAEQEGKYALKALLPKAYIQNSFVMDIGSGNTKISFYEGAVLKSFEGPGAKYFQKGMTDEQAAAEIAKIAQKVPADKRQNCFIIGGVPFELAKQVRNGDERFTYLNSPDGYSAGDDVKIKSGLNIYSSVINTTQCPNYIFDWDANFTIGFLLSLN